MTAPQTDLKTQLEELSADAFTAFCDDISGMFGVPMNSALSPGAGQTVQTLKKKFKKLTAVITVRGSGAVEGDYHFVFDKEGLFTLAGTIVMLPEQRIMVTRKSGSVKEAEELQDAVGETGNLLVGSWDRIFRENLEGHKHFLQTGTFIGNPWEDPQKDIGLSDHEEFLFFQCEMTVGSFEPFHCGIIFPEALFQKQGHDVPEAADTAAEQPQEPGAVVEETQDGQPPPPEDVVPQASADEEPSEPVVESIEPPQEAVVSEGAPAKPAPREAAAGTVSGTIQKMVQAVPGISSIHTSGLLQTAARDIMTKQLLWAGPDDSVQHVLEKMQQADAACALVGRADALEGIVAWIDIAEAVSVYLRPVFAKWRRPEDEATLHIKLKIIMTRPVRTVTCQTPLAAIMEDMCCHRLRCLPVVSEQGHVVGVVTSSDIFKYLLKLSPDFSLADAPSPSAG